MLSCGGFIHFSLRRIRSVAVASFVKSGTPCEQARILKAYIDRTARSGQKFEPIAPDGRLWISAPTPFAHEALRRLAAHYIAAYPSMPCGTKSCDPTRSHNCLPAAADMVQRTQMNSWWSILMALKLGFFIHFQLVLEH